MYTHHSLWREPIVFGDEFKVGADGDPLVTVAQDEGRLLVAAAVQDMAKKIAEKSALATHLSKKALTQGAYQDFEQTLEQEIRDAMVVLSSSEAPERARIALEKTKKKEVKKGERK